MKKKLSITIYIVLAFLLSVFIYYTCKINIVDSVSTKNISTSTPTVNSLSSQVPQELVETPLPSETPEIKLPETVNLDIQFISQAPFAFWDNLHNEACEEASIISATNYFDQTTLSPSEIDEKIQSMVGWQESNFGGHYDLPSDKIKELVDGFYLGKYKTKVVKDFNIDDIKKELAEGNPVIVPLSGRTIGNPYFRQPGPVYHVLVIRGYDSGSGEFITNDVGTNKEGENMRYSYDVIFDSIHDMPKWEQYKDLLDQDPDMIFNGQKSMVIITK
jgi:hypothetical protein